MKNFFLFSFIACFVSLGFTSASGTGTTFDPKSCSSGVYNDGCNTCTVAKDGTIGACTKMACFVAGTPHCIDTNTGTANTGMAFDPKSCVGGVYNDGCNTCNVGNNGVAACTAMYCEKPGKPFCINAGTGMMVGNDKDEYGCIGSAGYIWSSVLNQCVRPRELYDIKIEEIPNIGISSIDAELQVFANEQRMAFVKDAEDTIAVLWTGSTCKPEMNLSRNIANNKDNILSIVATKYIYTCGAHGNTITSTFNFNKKKAKLIRLPELFKSFGKSLKVISNNTYNGLVKKLGAKDNDAKTWIKDGTSVQEYNFANYTFSTENGKVLAITFYFDQYQVAPYSQGQSEATISFPSLKFVK